MSWRRALVLCAAVGTLHALAWSVINPVGQGPDELAHTSMVAYVAIHRDYPRPDPDAVYGDEHDHLYRGLPFSVQGWPTWSEAHEQLVRDRLAAARRGSYPPRYRYATNNPPLYYVAAAAPTALLNERDLVDRIWAMRLVSALLMGVLVVFCFLFVREVLPRSPWAWMVGALAVALQPLVGFMGGSVSPDNLLYPSAAALFYFLARAFRRGLTPATALGIGVAALCGSLAKGTMFGLLPGAALGVLWIAWRDRSAGARRVLVPIAAGAAVFAIPFAVWLWANSAVFERPASTTTSGVSASGQPALSVVRALTTYVWQHFLPRLPFMHDHFPDHLAPAVPGADPFPAFPQYPLWQIWHEGFVGRFSYSVYSFPLWVEILAAVIYVAASALAAIVVWRVVRGARERRPELLTYFLLLAGNFLLVAVNGYFHRRGTGGMNFEQARYLLPMIPLYGLVLATACVALGRRAPAGALAVGVLALGHAVGGLVLTLDRYYAG